METLIQPATLPVAPDTPYRKIEVTEIQRGEGDVVATFTLRIGSVVVHRVQLRRGRRNSHFVNFPAFRNEHGRWCHLVEIVSPALETAVNDAIYRAVSEAMR